MEEQQKVELLKILGTNVEKQDKIAKVEELIHRKISKKAKFLLDQAFELAAGIYTIDERDPLKIKYYKQPPKLDAIIYLIDRLIGKPVAKQENYQSKEKAGVAAVQNIIINLAGAGNKNGNGPTTKSADVIDVRPSEDFIPK